MWLLFEWRQSMMLTTWQTAFWQTTSNNMLCVLPWPLHAHPCVCVSHQVVCDVVSHVLCVFVCVVFEMLCRTEQRVNTLTWSAGSWLPGPYVYMWLQWCMCVWERECVCVWERERERERECECICVSERESVYVCVSERERVSVCTYVCVWERESVCVSERECVCVCAPSFQNGIWLKTNYTFICVWLVDCLISCVFSRMMLSV